MANASKETSTVDTGNIEYNYKIARALFDNANIRQTIRKEIELMIQLQIDLIISYYQVSNPGEQLMKLQNVFFKNKITEQGQLATPYIKIDGKYKPIATVNEFKGPFIKSLNFRELMSMMRNFAAAENDCIMYSILVDYDEAKKSKVNTTNVDEFKRKYPMLNIDVVDEAVIMIENILGFNISETTNCYSDLRGKELRKCTKNTKPYYLAVQDAHLQQKTASNERIPQSPITLCWLWHPLVYGTPYQDVVKLPADNFVKQLNNSYEPVTSSAKQNAYKCMVDTYNKYPIFPPLSQREQQYLKTQGVKLNKGIDGQYTNPPWNPPFCYMKRSEPTSFMINLLDRNKKYSVSNLSGHIMKFIMMAKYFKLSVGSDKPINLDLIVLASILFMVPYNHSIHEIFQSAKMMGVNTEYSIEKSDLENVNDMLIKTNMKIIKLTTSSNIDNNIIPAKRTTVKKEVANVSSMSEGLTKKGGMKRMSKRNGKHVGYKTRGRKQVGCKYKKSRKCKKTRKTKQSRYEK